LLRVAGEDGLITRGWLPPGQLGWGRAARGEGNAVVRLNDIALERSDYDSARTRYEQGLALYQAIPDPCSAGWTLVDLARLDPSGSERARALEFRRVTGAVAVGDTVADNAADAALCHGADGP